jgi:PKHD-type hydroxylase
MSIYQFVPAKDHAGKETVWSWWEDAFNEDQLKQIVAIGDQLVLSEGKVDGDKCIEDVRRCKTGWMHLNKDTKFVYEIFSSVLADNNAQFWGFNLFGFVEPFQFTVYEPDNNHYTWHIDKGYNTPSPRKLSGVLFLSDPSEYEGGDLELLIGNEPIQLEKKLGRMYFFPSWVLHRVTPVTKGTRKTLVAWASGPKFV